MAQEKNKSVPASYVFLKKDNEILLGRRKNTGYYDGWYGMPAGHVDATELPLHAAAREAKEEIGIDVNLEDVQFAHALYRAAHDETGERSDYFFMVEKWQGEPKITEPDKCDDLKWFPIDKLPENMIDHERWALGKIKEEITYSEIDAKHTSHNPTKR